MRVDWNLLMVLIGAGALWVLGLSVVTLMSSPAVIAGAIGYILVFSAVLASRRVPLASSVLAAWVVAVVGAGVFMSVVDGNEPGMVVFAAGLLGSFLVAAWLVPAFFVLLLADPDLAKSARSRS